MLDTKTPPEQLTGGGFGPTVQLDDGTLVTSYSYAGPGEWGENFQSEVVHWRLPQCMAPERDDCVIVENRA